MSRESGSFFYKISSTIFCTVAMPKTPDIDGADRLLTAAEKTLAFVTTQPESGAISFVRKPELQGMRRFPVSDGFEKILLFYFPLENGVDIVRELRRMGPHSLRLDLASRHKHRCVHERRWVVVSWSICVLNMWICGGWDWSPLTCLGTLPAPAGRITIIRVIESARPRS